MPWLQQVKGVLATYTAGDGLGSAVASVLFGEVNPSGKLAETMPVKLEHNPSYLTFRESKTDIRYSEGIFVGYRWYEKRALPVAFPFGHGLSYTTFAYSDLTLSHTTLPQGETLVVTMKVTNTGIRAGKECVQLYVGDVETSLPRPVKELKGFRKVLLEPGETKVLTFSLDKRAFAFYDTQLGDWAVEPGSFLISVGASSQDIRLTATVEVEAEPWRPLRSVTQETTYGELVDDPRTFPLLCGYLSQSPMYRPAEMPDAPDFLRNLPLWTLNHMAGRPVSPQQLTQWVEELNQAIR
jgi:beta-glucosidase